MMNSSDLAAVVERLTRLEDSQKSTVDSVLEEIRQHLRSSMFSKEKVFDYLVNLKIKADKAGFYGAVLYAMQQKARVPDSVFKKIRRGFTGEQG